jgi:hypothetical protein
MSEYTPTMEQIRYGWAVFSNWKRVPTCGRVQAEKDFDDWLKAHDAEVRNATLEEAARIAREMTDNEDDGYYGQACFEIAAAIRAEKEGTP